MSINTDKSPDTMPKVIVIGASAGGLDGLLNLFAGLPPQQDTAFIIAQHMARDDHARLVCSLLKREGQWQVCIPEDGTLIEGGYVYLLPAEQDGTLEQGYIRLYPPCASSYSSPSINRLLRSVADELGPEATAIILSGAGSDGAFGSRAIRQKGGKLWVQSPQEAQYNSMPLASLEQVSADLVGTVDEITQGLNQLLHPQTSAADSVIPKTSPRPAPKRRTAALTPSDSVNATDRQIPDHTAIPTSQQEIELEVIIQLLQERTGISFTGYKTDTLFRRLDKRKAQLGLEQPGQYLEYLQNQPEEAGVLEQFLLVSVSSFFRDAEVFKALSELLKNSSVDWQEKPVFRMLVAGCATGEEAYSLAMLWQELGLEPQLEILALDLNLEAIRIAETGIYPAQKLSKVPESLIERHFTASVEGYRARPELKQHIRFIQSDLQTLNTEEHFDLISCRNLMIYLKREEQEHLIQRFHRQMTEQALLMIGLTESLSPLGQRLFRAEDHFHRLYRRRHNTGSHRNATPPTDPHRAKHLQAQGSQKDQRHRKEDHPENKTQSRKSRSEYSHSEHIDLYKGASP